MDTLTESLDRKQRLAIVLPSLEVGGTEILWLEFLRQISEIETTLIVLSNRIDPNLILPTDRIVICSNMIAKNNFFLTYCFGSVDLSKFDHIHCVDRFVLGHVVVAAKKKICAKVTLGIYHSKEMLWMNRAYYSRMQLTFFRELFPKNIYFGNHKVRQIYEDYFRTNIDHGCVFPAGVRLFNLKDRHSPFFHIVVIGRHTNFKNYIGNFLRVWKKNNFGLKPTLKITVVGEGPLTNKLKAEFSEALFVGTLQRQELEDLLQKADIAVCGGTTAPLVSSTGTTVLVGAENQDDDLANGFFHEISKQAYNLKDTVHTQISFPDAIQRYYKELQFLDCIHFDNRVAASDFDITKTFSGFTAFFANVSANSFPTSKFISLRYRISLLIWITYEMIFKRKIIRERYK